MLVDVIASQAHYLDHLRPVWKAIPPGSKNVAVVPPHLHTYAEGLGFRVGQAGYGDTALTAGWRDARGAQSYRRVALMEHGVGQTYDVRSPGYANGLGRFGVDLFLCPNDRVARANAHPDNQAEVRVIGSPLLDELDRLPPIRKRFDLAFTTHYDASDVTPEAGTGFEWFAPAIANLAQDLKIIGTGHPRIWPQVQRWCGDHHVMSAYDLRYVIRSASTLLCDNSSVMFYAAALGTPIIVANPPQYRRDVEHGLRFWEFADIGIQLNDSADLLQCVLEAPEYQLNHAERVREICSDLFPLRDGGSAHRVLEALEAIQ